MGAEHQERRIASFKFMGNVLLVIGTLTIIYGWIVFPYFPLYIWRMIDTSWYWLWFGLIVSGIFTFVFGFLLYDYSQKKYRTFKKEFYENGGIPLST